MLRKSWLIGLVLFSVAALIQGQSSMQQPITDAQLVTALTQISAELKSSNSEFRTALKQLQIASQDASKSLQELTTSFDKWKAAVEAEQAVQDKAIKGQAADIAVNRYLTIGAVVVSLVALLVAILR